MVSRVSASHKAIFMRAFQSPHPTEPLTPDWIRPDHSLNNLMHFRYYGSNIGRFLKPDNVTGSPLNPQNWNLYSYVRGNPVNMNDPTGHAGTRLAQALLPPPSGSAWEQATQGTSPEGDTPKTDQDKQEEKQQQENKPPEGANDSRVQGPPTPEQFALASVVYGETSGLRGEEVQEMRTAVASTILNRYEKVKDKMSLEDFIKSQPKSQFHKDSPSGEQLKNPEVQEVWGSSISAAKEALSLTERPSYQNFYMYPIKGSKETDAVPSKPAKEGGWWQKMEVLKSYEVYNVEIKGTTTVYFY